MRHVERGNSDGGSVVPDDKPQVANESESQMLMLYYCRCRTELFHLFSRTLVTSDVEAVTRDPKTR